MAGGTSWFSRTFGKASTKKSKAKTGKEASETASASTEAEADGATAVAASSPEAEVSSAASETVKKMCVDDFEPLKLIGRGAFGAYGFVSRRARGIFREERERETYTLVIFDAQVR